MKVLLKNRSARKVARIIRKSVLLLLPLPLIGVTHGSFAQDAIDTHRPGFSASPYVLSPGAWQIETGLSYERDLDGAGSTLVTLPSALLRYGATDEMEVLFSWDGLSRSSTGSGTSTGITDASVGIKFQVTDSQASTGVAFFAALSVPIGDAEFSSDKWDPSIGVAWAHSGLLNWGGTAQLTKHGSDYQLDNGVKITFATSADSSAFAEWEANIPDSGAAAHKLNGGYVWRRGLGIQFDVNASVGLNDAAADYILGLGYSYRF